MAPKNSHNAIHLTIFLLHCSPIPAVVSLSPYYSLYLTTEFLFSLTRFPPTPTWATTPQKKNSPSSFESSFVKIAC